MTTRSKHRPAAATMATCFLLACAALPACGGDAPPPAVIDPRGTDATFNFSWRVNGRAPTLDNGACLAAGIRFIRMNVVDPTNVESRFDAFRFDCHLGSYRSTMPELRAGTYRIYWEAISPEGNRVSLASGNFDANGVLQPTLETLTVTRGTHVDFDAANHDTSIATGQPTNFSTGRGPLEVRLSWAQMPGATTGVDCATAGVAFLNWTLRLSNGVPADTHAAREVCTPAYAALRWDNETGGMDSRLNFDNYILDVNGYTAGSSLEWRVRCENLLAATADGAGSVYDCRVDRIAP